MADSAFCAFGEKISEKELTNIIKNMLALKKNSCYSIFTFRRTFCNPESDS